MQHLQVVISAFFLASGVFQVSGVLVSEDDYDSLLHKKEVFSKATSKSLWKSLDYDGYVEITDTLALVLVKLSRDPREDGIYFLMSDIFLRQLQIWDPQSDFFKAWRAMSYIIYMDRENRAKGEAVSVEELIPRALKKYQLGYIDPAIFEGLVPSIRNVINRGDLQEAKELVSEVAKHFVAGFKRLNNLRYDTKMHLLENVVKELHWWAKDGLSKSIESARPK